jgi:hypothetical protein
MHAAVGFAIGLRGLPTVAMGIRISRRSSTSGMESAYIPGYPNASIPRHYEVSIGSRSVVGLSYNVPSASSKARNKSLTRWLK